MRRSSSLPPPSLVPPLAVLLLGPLAPVALAHGAEVPPEPTALTFLLGWSFDLAIQVPVALSVLVWFWLLRRVDRLHPGHPVPRSRTALFLGALLAIEVALQSGIERYDTTLFSVHMVQHILLMFVAAPFLALSAPVTLLLRAATPAVRTRRILPILHSRALRALTFPVVAWVLFAGVMWGSHFSPLFEAALEDPLIHDLEHALFLGSALLFWWPALGRDPAPWRMPPAGRVAYLFLQMPQNTFLSIAILWASAPLYRHYVTLERTWGPTVLEDQQAAGAIMWLLGDATFLIAVLGVVAGWMRKDERETARADARADAALATIRERERALAERKAREAADHTG